MIWVGCRSSRSKIFPFFSAANHRLNARIPFRKRGRRPSLPNVGAGCGGRGRAGNDRHGGVRPSRVVLTPLCWRQVGGYETAGDGDTAWTPGRARYRPSNHCAGKAGVFPLHLFARVRAFKCTNAHETAGAARTRSSPRPLFEGRVRPLRLTGVNEIECLGQNHVARTRTHISSSRP